MDTEDVRLLLDAVASGTVGPDDALARLAAGPLGDGSGWTDLGYARVDTHRGLRTGDPEVVYAAGKTPAQTVGIVAELRRTAGPGRPTLVTRADAATVTALRARWPDELTTSAQTPAEAPGGAFAALSATAGHTAAATTGHANTANHTAGHAAANHPVGHASHSVFAGHAAGTAQAAATVAIGPLPAAHGRVVVVCAGTSDAPVAAEAALTTRASGVGVETIMDVGVAGLHRVLAVRDRLAEADCLIVIAGMEGALPSVIGGLVGTPVVAVPTSVGYGASFGGLTALLAMLTSCAPGIAVCNIDNGFGAGIFAARVARRSAAASAPQPQP
ncbi:MULTISPECIES: nickel pincer cofactor biosynthesis protein LarB [Protofrankia]|uniref:1-(5-phosphoribosyl)-5-amino-4-imidazole-carboxylate (AIR) carboxylase n=1 Tax=Candidatus Protofrankia datiscae TaxID=2716812 RepID=F8B0W5_9ACTN|nr:MULTISPECIES: nickel pincer cofactor biosynthesis protein LarB [Protofrankia]AEH07800.1 1-(5-phosphoribosyl)-5-amino-4-imidazole-carboxylate (AIR) carboxylase [Candidatus Protofrankia datiscae]